VRKPDGADPPPVHVRAAERTVLDGVMARLHEAGLLLTPDPATAPDTVIVAAARKVQEAADMCADAGRPGGSGLLVVASSFGRTGMMRALRVGVRVMLRSAELDPPQLVVAVRAAQLGDFRLPREALSRLLSPSELPGETAPEFPVAAPALTERQTTVLSLVAEGLGNAAIARELAVSQHTVKNVLYEVMARLQVSNRSHAVARAVKAGII
jgi:DNA-binding NarL/FixJ family response regulator